MKKHLLGLAVLLTTVMSCENHEQNPKADAELETNSVLNYSPAKTNGELVLLTKDPNVNMIRSIADFDKMVDKQPALFTNLSEQELSDFRGNLVFMNGGIAGATYKIIKAKLSKANYITVMARLGLDVANGFWPGASFSANTRSTEDYEAYKCSGVIAHTCIKDQNAICTSNCP